MRTSFQSKLTALSIIVAFGAPAARGQWLVFDDPESDSLCGIINAFDVELVVRECDNALVVVSDNDRVVPGAFVDDQGTIMVDGNPFGFVAFDTDGDGFRTVWWLVEDGRVVQFDQNTFDISVSDLFAGDAANVPCDAAEFWDDQADCGQDNAGPPPNTDGGNVNPPRINLCGAGTTGATAVSLLGCAFLSLGTRRIRRR